MKEWLIRIGCVLLGVVLTLGTTHLVDLLRDFNQDTVIEAQEEEEKEDIQVEDTKEEGGDRKKSFI